MPAHPQRRATSEKHLVEYCTAKQLHNQDAPWLTFGLGAEEHLRFVAELIILTHVSSCAGYISCTSAKDKWSAGKVLLLDLSEGATQYQLHFHLRLNRATGMGKREERRVRYGAGQGRMEWHDKSDYCETTFKAVHVG